eukprot:494325-Prymnesium_polylepis.1
MPLLRAGLLRSLPLLLHRRADAALALPRLQPPLAAILSFGCALLPPLPVATAARMRPRAVPTAAVVPRAARPVWRP